MMRVPWESAGLPATTIEVLPIGRSHLAGFHAALDSVARERRYLALLAAPPFVRTRRFVLDSLKEGAVHLVAVHGDKVVGWCDLRPKAAPALRHSGVLGMGLLASYRGRGIGTRLLAATLEQAASRGLWRVELIVRSDNAAAIALYRRFGFEVEGTCRRYLRLDGMDYDALLMARLEPVHGSVQGMPPTAL